jgi:hypothetical protein
MEVFNEKATLLAILAHSYSAANFNNIPRNFRFCLDLQQPYLLPFGD